MDFQTLQQALAPRDGRVQIDVDTLGGAFTAFLGGYYFKQSKQIRIDQATLQADGGVVRVIGKAGFNTVDNLPGDLAVDARFSVDAAGAAQATLRYTLIGEGQTAAAWRFSTSFPALPVVSAPLGDDEDVEVDLSLDAYQFDRAWLVVSTHAQDADAELAVPLAEGINFVGQLRSIAIFGVVGANVPVPAGQKHMLHGAIRVLADDTQLAMPQLSQDLAAAVVYPWDVEAQLPGIHLQLRLFTDVGLGKLKLKDAAFRIYNPLSMAWQDRGALFNPVTAFTGTLAIPSAGIEVDAVGALQPGATGVYIGLRCKGLSLNNLGQLADLVGIDLLAPLPKSLADVVHQVGKLQITDLGFSIGAVAGGLGVGLVSVGIGIPDVHWKIWDDIFVTGLGLRFRVDGPTSQAPAIDFEAWGSADIEGTALELQTRYGGSWTITAKAGPVTLPLKKLLASRSPKVPAPADLTINTLLLTLALGDSYSLAGALADSPEAWVIKVGPGKLKFSDLTFDLNIPQQGEPSGSFRGTIDFGDGVTLAGSVESPGAFSLRGDVEKWNLRHLVKSLTNQAVTLPDAFDITFLESSVMIQGSAAGLVFQLATEVKDLGTFAFEARQVSDGVWGLAGGLDVTVGKPSRIPGLSALTRFEEMFRLEKFMLVLASYPNPGFRFPDLGQFNNPQLNAKSVQLPPSANGLQAGLNVFAEWHLDVQDKQHKLLKDLLHLDAVVDVMLSIGANPFSELKMVAGVATKIMGHPCAVKYGAILTATGPSLFFTGSITVEIQGQPQTFDLTGVFTPGGALMSADMKGNAPIDFKLFKLANVGLEIGVDWIGIPSLGVTGTLDIGRFESFLAVFFDSTNPAHSMVAGALSELPLSDVLATLLGGPAAASALDQVLPKVRIVGTHRFQIPGSLAGALDDRALDQVAAACAQQGKLTIPSTTQSALLVTGVKGSAWHLTDLTTMKHYGFKKKGDQIEVSLDPQFYFAPQPTYIGTISYPARFYLGGALTFLNFQVSAEVEISPYKGVTADVQMDKIVLAHNEALFAIKAAKGDGGPRLSVSTYPQLDNPDPRLRLPHFLINGELSLLGLRYEVFANFTIKGLEIELSESVGGVALDLKGTLDEHGFAATVAAKVGLGAIDLGALGKVKLDSDVEGSLHIAAGVDQIAASGEAAYQLLGARHAIASFAVATSPDALLKLAETFGKKVQEDLTNVFKSVDAWANAVKKGAVKEVQDVEKVLTQQFGKSAADAKKMADDINSTFSDATKAVGQAAGDATKAVGDAAKDAGKEASKDAKKVGKSIKKAFKF